MTIQNLGQKLVAPSQHDESTIYLPSAAMSPLVQVMESIVLDETPPPVPPKSKICGTQKSANVSTPHSSCSLACSNVHKSAHPVQSPTNASSRKSSPPKSTDLSASRQPSLKIREPFTSLDESEDLQTLFKIYPNLSKILGKIHEATLPPSVDCNACPNLPQGRSGRAKKEPPWTSDIGLQKGVNALHAAQLTGDVDGEAVRAYSQLVLSIVHGNPEESAVDRIRQEMVEHDTKIIERLLIGKT
ncbi:putative zinc finger family protein [Golovinomyces cichoracearum]|uniref:Putative zinc finger family protein n=1 Tax=Golovinomyces cichoracearum TaxID=62708 RepID=A0A420IQ80_9PEZI|nr:putative zinc finger family protein [Golovinomyces cichoracearum]